LHGRSLEFSKYKRLSRINIFGNIKRPGYIYPGLFLELKMGFEPMNLLITNQLLYRLSYSSIFLC
jgi:hypothetical protein